MAFKTVVSETGFRKGWTLLSNETGKGDIDKIIKTLKEGADIFTKPMGSYTRVLVMHVT